MTEGNEPLLSKQLRVTLGEGHRWLTEKESCSEFDGGGEEGREGLPEEGREGLPDGGA